jgi:NADH dehydrogenase subunit B (EC 1.6.5.3)
MPEDNAEHGTDAPYTSEQFINAEKEMSYLTQKSLQKAKLSGNVMFTKMGEIAKLAAKPIKDWGRTNSLWPLQFGLACCAIELMAFGSPRIDAERKGYLLFRATPRQCDVMVVAGWVTKSMAPRIKRLYEQMSEPRYVVSFGECATSGGPWYESYNIIHGIDQILPVDVYAVGCPPRPENLFMALIKLQDKIRGDTNGDSEKSISENIKRNEI